MVPILDIIHRIIHHHGITAAAFGSIITMGRRLLSDIMPMLVIVLFSIIPIFIDPIGTEDMDTIILITADTMAVDM